MRYAYVKTNHVVDEFRRVIAQPHIDLEGGPDAYVANFLKIVGDSPTLLLSVHFQPEHDAKCKEKNIEAWSFYWRSRWLRSLGKYAKKPIFTLGRRIYISIRICYLLIKLRPNYIYCWAHSFPLWSAYLASRICHSAFVYSRHTRIFWEHQPWYLRVTDIVDQWIMRRASSVVVHGPYLKEQIIRVGVDPNRVYEYNWGFKHLQSGDTLPKLGLHINRVVSQRVILFIGRIQKEKGVYDLLDAFEGIHNATSNKVILVYAGQGTDLAGITKQVEERGLQNVVSFLGMLQHSSLASVIEKAMVVVTPTRTEFPEGRCMAVMEALVMGVPVIAPEWGPFPYLVENESNGLLFKPNSIKELENAIFRIINDEQLYNELRLGARISGEKLRSPVMGFMEAVQKAFANSPT